MVVGTGVYKDTNEAYPLDKKTLGAVALRSLIGSGARNAETGESIGWLWALMPALKKIHTDEDDLSLCMGHHLESVKASSPLTTLTMGVVLSLEQQKADPQTIRAVRTALGAAADGAGLSMIRFILIPLIALLCASMASDGNVLAAVLLVACTALVSVCLRMVLINIGYGKGVRAAESLIRRRDALNHASAVAGLFMLGALSVLLTSMIPVNGVIETASQSVSYSKLFSQVMPGIGGLLAAGLAYYMLAKKNRPLYLVMIVFILIGFAGAAAGIWGDFTAPWLIGG